MVCLQQQYLLKRNKPLQDRYQEVTKAYRLANQGEVVLLSPASASLDMYSNYIERGNHFKEIVHQIIL